MSYCVIDVMMCIVVRHVRGLSCDILTLLGVWNARDLRWGGGAEVFHEKVISVEGIHVPHPTFADSVI